MTAVQRQLKVNKMRILPLLPLVLVIFIAGCSDCRNDPLDMTASPDDGYLAISYARSCGPDAKVDTHVSVLERPGHLLNKDGNALIVEGKHSIGIKWLSERKIELDISKAEAVKKKVSVIDGVTVLYSE